MSAATRSSGRTGTRIAEPAARTAAAAAATERGIRLGPLAWIGAAALTLAGCETAFVGRAPAGRYALVEVNGARLPYMTNPGHHCPVQIVGGRFDLDAVARRFEMVLDETGPCLGYGRGERREAGTYLRSGSRLDLETGSGARIPATESGGTVTVGSGGLRLRFRRGADAPERR